MSESWMWMAWGAMIIVSFAMIEGFAMRHPDREKTLSYCIAWLGSRFPLSIGVVCLIFGVAVSHFWWHYCPFGGSMG